MGLYETRFLDRQGYYQGSSHFEAEDDEAATAFAVMAYYSPSERGFEIWQRERFVYRLAYKRGDS